MLLQRADQDVTDAAVRVDDLTDVNRIFRRVETLRVGSSDRCVCDLSDELSAEFRTGIDVDRRFAACAIGRRKNEIAFYVDIPAVDGVAVIEQVGLTFLLSGSGYPLIAPSPREGSP